MIWDENPAFFVSLLRQGISPDEALTKSKDMCIKFKPNTKEDCIIKQENLYFALDLSGTSQIQPDNGEHLLTSFPSNKNVKVVLQEKKIPFWISNVLFLCLLVFGYLLIKKIQ